MENKSDSKNQTLTIDDIINEIKEKSADSDYIYRGEHRRYLRVSSAFYREYSKKIRETEFDLRIAEKEMLNAAKKHLGLPAPIKRDNEIVPELLFLDKTALSNSEIEILTELQHYGGKTNLIDFTTDYLIAIFFACAGHSDRDGRVILQDKNKMAEEDMIIYPQNPRHRVIVQKSVFLHPSTGFIKPRKDDIVTIPAAIKQPFLNYLRKFHDISTETIYNDIHGFIRNQDIHRSAYTDFYLGLALQRRASYASTDARKRERYKEAIQYYDVTIAGYPDLEVAYGNRGECWLHLEKWDKAREDLTAAKNMHSDIIGSFHNDYKDVAEFEEKTGLKMPEDLAEMLGG